MVHSFSQSLCSNGNVIVSFYENNKKRQIIFTKGTKALEWYNHAIQYHFEMGSLKEYSNESLRIKASIEHIRNGRNGFVFKSNPNNPSIFRPIEKVQ